MTNVRWTALTSSSFLLALASPACDPPTPQDQGTLLRQWRIEFSPLSEEIGTGNRRVGESVRLPLPDGSFLIDSRQRDREAPREGYFRPPIAYMRVDTDYSAYSFGWWEDLEQFRIYPPAGALGLLPIRAPL